MPRKTSAPQLYTADGRAERQKAPSHPATLAHVRARTESALSIVDQHPAGCRFMLGEQPTIVHFSLAGYLYDPSEETGFDLAAAYLAIDAWRGRVAALPGWKPPYEMMPVGNSMPMRR
ncbi:MAG: hypothetical protein AAB403_12785 [Planctomycetota bacterium]